MEYYGNNDWRDYLAHYGVKGMKWRHHKYKTDSSYLNEGGVSGYQVYDTKKGRLVYNHSTTKKPKLIGTSSYYKSAARSFKRRADVAGDFAKASYKDIRGTGIRNRNVGRLRAESNGASDKRRMYTDANYNRKTLGGFAERTISRGKGTSKKVQKKLSRLKDRAVGYVSKKKKDYEYKRNFRRGVKYTRKMLRG